MNAIHDRIADAVSFGTPNIANPDLPYRFLTGALLLTSDRATYYVEGPAGYVDDPCDSI